MSNFVPGKRHLREVLLHYFFLKKSAAESHRLLVEAYKEHAPSVSMCKKWFKRFKSIDFDLDDKEHRKPAPLMKKSKIGLITRSLRNIQTSTSVKSVYCLEDGPRLWLSMEHTLNKALLKKMTSSSRSFPWRSASLLLLLLIGAIVAYDTQKHGSFEASQVGKFLKTSGILKHVEKAWTTLKFYWSAGHKAVKDSSPEYYKAVVDLCAPYIKLAGDICLIVRNVSIKLYNNVAAYVERNVPIIIDTIEHYAPGILEQIKSRSLQVLEFVKVSFILIGEKVIEHSSASIQWLEKNVFIGKLSPDNLRSYAIWAFDTTQSYAAQTYDWVYEKVQTLSKVP